MLALADRTPRRRAPTIVAAVAVSVAAVALALLFVTAARRSPTSKAAPVVSTVSAYRFSFDKDVYRVPAGKRVGIRVHNADRALHTFTVPELGIDRLLRPGAATVVEVEAPAGRYVIYCRPHADLTEANPQKAGMAATLVAV